MSSPNELTLAEARDALKAKTLSARELTQAHLDAMGKARVLNAYLLETPERALAMADASDAKIAAGAGGPLEGIPLGIKDLFCTDGVETTAGSKILKGFEPHYESAVSANLWRDGAVMLGKLNLDEFAMGSSNETSAFGNVISPWRRQGSEAPIVPGGSSGGSAAAVAARLCLGATATDTGGSIRQPAAFTGTVGIKPTYGRCSRWGTVAFASSLDQAGPIARTVRDCAILLASMAGADARDTTCADLPVPDYEASVGRGVKGLTIGIPKEYRVDGMPAEIQKLWDEGAAWLRAAGATIKEISLPHTSSALPAYYIVARPKPPRTSPDTTACATACGCRQGHRRHVREHPRRRFRPRGEAPDHDWHLRAQAGYYDAYYVRAQKIRTLIKRDFEAAYAVGSTRSSPPHPLGRLRIGEKANADPVEMYLNDVFTVTVNMAGLPGIAVPAGLDGQGLPLGLQLIAVRSTRRRSSPPLR